MSSLTTTNEAGALSALDVIEILIQSNEKVVIHRDVFSRIMKRLMRIKNLLKENNNINIDTNTFERVLIELEFTCNSVQNFIKQQETINETCMKKHEDTKKQTEELLHNILSRLVKHEVDLIHNHEVKLQTHREAILEQHSLKQKAFSEEMKRRTEEVGQKMKANAQKQLVNLHKQYSHIIQPYLKRSLDLHGTVPINGAEASVVGRVVESLYEISSIQRDILERVWKKFEMPLDYIPTQLRVDTSTSYERKAARQMVMVDHRLPSNMFSEEKPPDSWKQRLLAAPYMPSMVERDRLITKNDDESIQIKDILREHRWIVILGDPGTGKTSFVQWLSASYVRALLINQNELEFGPARIPIVIRIGEFADALRKNIDLTLFDYIGKHRWFGKSMYSEGESSTNSSQKLALALQDYVRQGQALIILDGLDEIVVSDERIRLVNLVESFVDTYIQTPSHNSVFDERFFGEIIDKPAELGGNQLVVTSRIVGYHAAPLSGQFVHYIIKKMNLEHINAFVDNWFKKIHIEIIRVLSTIEISIDDSQNKWEEQANNLKVELSNPIQIGLQELSSNACLLSFICSIAFGSQETSLPSQRILLYEKTVNAMIDSWKNKETNDTTIQGSKVITMFCDIACYIHMHSAAGLIEETKLKELCIQSLHSYEGKKAPTNEDFIRVENDAIHFLEVIRRDVGVLAERGESFYGFIHLTFQEYFVCLDLINVTKYRRIFASSSEETLSDVQVIARSLHHHINDPRFRVPIALSFGRLSSKWRKKADTLDNLCIEFLKFDSSSVFPICALFLINSINDFVLQPSPDILIKALDRLLIIVGSNQWYFENSMFYSQMKDVVHKLPDNVINKWIRSVLSSSSCNNIHTISALSQFIVKEHEATLQIKGMDVSTCELLTQYLSHDNENNNFAIDILLIRISITNHQLIPIDSTSLKNYFMHQNIDIKTIHLSILALIITLYGGLRQDETKMIFDPSRMHRESSFVTPLIIQYISNKSQSHQVKIIQFEKKCMQRLSTIENNDNLVEVVDALITMLCVFGVKKLFTLPSLWSTTVFSMALNRLKHVSMIIRQFYVVTDYKVIHGSLTSYLNQQLMMEIDSKDKNNQVLAHNVVQLVKSNLSAFARLRSGTRPILLPNANFAEYGLVVILPSSFRDDLLLKQLLSKNITLSSNQLSCSILPEFVQLFWVLEQIADQFDDIQDRITMGVVANLVPSLLVYNNDSDPAFALAFVPDHFRALYFRLMEDHDILVNIQGSIKSHHKPVLLFQHILIQSLIQLENHSCKKVSLEVALCVMLPLLRIHGLENMVTKLTSNLTSDDKDYIAQIEFTKHRPIDYKTGQYTDEFMGLVDYPESYNNRRTHYEIALTSIQEEKKRINDALLLLNSNSEDMDANSQLYSASVVLSHVCWLSVDVESSILFTEALEAASLITQPLLRFDALCSIALSSEYQPTTERLKNGYTLKEELERQLLQITSDLHCTLHAAILLRCYSLCLQTNIIEISLRELLKKMEKADNFDQQVINRALFGTLRFNPVIRSHLLNSLEQQNYESIKLFEMKSSTFQRYFSNQTYNDDSADNVGSALLSSMFTLELTSDTNLITEWLNSDTRSLGVDPSTENLQFIRQNKILTGSILTYSQAVIIDQFLQSIDKNSFGTLKDLSVELHSVSTMEPIAQRLVEGWLNFEDDLTLCSFAFHAALLLLQSNLWSIKAIDIVCNLLVNEQDRFRQRAEMIFKLDNIDQIQTSTQLTLEILLKLKECLALFRHKSPYAALMCLRKQENIEINQRSHLDAILLLERQRILVTNMNMDNVGSYTLSPVFATVFETHSVKNILDVPFTSNLNQFSQDIIQYMCELIESNFSKFWSNDNSKQSIQERDIHDRFIEEVIVALPMNRMNEKPNISMLIHCLTVLVNNSTSSVIQKAAVYILGFSTNENAVSCLFSILESVATNLFDDSHSYSDEVVSIAIRAYCYSVSKQEHDIHDNGQIEILRKLLEHPSVTISKATRYGLGRVLNTTDLMKILKSNHVHCYEALIVGTADCFVSDISDRCAESTTALIEQYPDLLSIFVQELYENIRYFTDDIYCKSSMRYMYDYCYPRYVNVAASIAERMPAAFCTFVNEFVDGENLKRSLYYTSKQHDFPRRAACLTVLSMFGELTTDLCEMLIQALLDDPYLQNTCYRCISRIHSIKDEQVINKLKEYLKSKSSNARYASCKLLLHLSNKPDVISIEQVQNIFDEVMSDPQSAEDLWLIVEQEDTMADSIYYNAGQLKDAIHGLFINHLINDVNTEKLTIDKETNNISVQQRDFIASEKASSLAGCFIDTIKKLEIDQKSESNDLVTSDDEFMKSSESKDEDDIKSSFYERDEQHSFTGSSSTDSVEDDNQLGQLT